MMKKLFFLIAMVALSLSSFAQSAPNRLIVTMKNIDKSALFIGVLWR